MAEVDNIAVVLYHYLRLLSVKVSRSTVHRLLDTPLGDSYEVSVMHWMCFM